MHPLSTSRSRRPPPNPIPKTPKRSLALIHILILIPRPQSLLVRVEVQPSVPNARRIRMLDQTGTHKSLHQSHVVGRGHHAGAAGGRAVDLVLDFGLLGVDVEDGVLLCSRLGR
jgi:hypothetical protein